MILLDRDSTPEDLEAKRAAPRPGVAGEPGADLRTLTQDETDALISAELVEAALPAERAAVLQAVGGEPVEIVVHVRPDAPQAELMGQRAISRQRRGIDSTRSSACSRGALGAIATAHVAIAFGSGSSCAACGMATGCGCSSRGRATVSDRSWSHVPTATSLGRASPLATECPANWSKCSVTA